MDKFFKMNMKDVDVEKRQMEFNQAMLNEAMKEKEIQSKPQALNPAQQFQMQYQ